MASAHLIPGIAPGRTVEFTYNDEKLSVREGEGIAAALMRAGIFGTRVTSRRSESRGYYCGMGVCWECMVEVVGEGFVRGCQYPVCAGLVVRSTTARLEEDR